MRIMMDCISLSLGAEYIGVHDLEGKEPLLQIWYDTDTIIIYLIYSNIAPPAVTARASQAVRLERSR